MAKAVFYNNKSFVVINEITPSTTILYVNHNQGIQPLDPGNEYIVGTLLPRSGEGDLEIIHIVEVNDNEFLIERGKEDTYPQSFLQGAVLEFRLTAEEIEAMNADRLREELASTDPAAPGAGLVGFAPGLVVSDLSDAENPLGGDAMLAVKQPIAGGVVRTQHDKNLEHVTLPDVGGLPSPEDSSVFFQILEDDPLVQNVDLLGNTYQVIGVPLTKHYYNGIVLDTGKQVIPVPPPPLEQLSGSPFIGEAYIPAGFNNRLRAIVRYSQGGFSSSVSFDQLDWASGGAGQIRYVSFSTGSDSNSGTTTSLPWKTLTKAFSESTSTSLVVRLLDRFIHREGGGHNTSPVAIGNNLKIVAYHASGEAIIGGFENPASLTWTRDGTTSGYTTPRTLVKSVFDAKYRDPSGLPRPLTLVSTVTELRATAGTWYHAPDDSSIEVNLFDGRAPDSNVLVVLSVGAWTLAQPSSGQLSLEGVKLIYSTPGQDCFRITSTTTPNTASLSMRNCAFMGAYNNGIAVIRTGTTVSEGCTAAYNGRDGFNYTDGSTPSPMVVYEVKNSAYEAGALSYLLSPTPTSSDNASTSHTGLSIMRVGCTYYAAKGGVVADVNGGYSLNYGVGVGESSSEVASTKASFFFDNTGGVSPAPKYLIGCSGGTSETFSISAPSDVDVRVQNWNGGLEVYPDTVIRNIDGEVVSS